MEYDEQNSFVRVKQLWKKRVANMRDPAENVICPLWVARIRHRGVMGQLVSYRGAYVRKSGQQKSPRHKMAKPFEQKPFK